MSELQMLAVYQICYLLQGERGERGSDGGVSAAEVMSVVRDNAICESLVEDVADVDELVASYMRVAGAGAGAGEEMACRLEAMYVRCRGELAKEVGDLDAALRNSFKREKLLNLYRDTVLNRLRSFKQGAVINEGGDGTGAGDGEVVRQRVDVASIRNETPNSIAEFQLALQRSIADRVMSERTGSAGWRLAQDVQTDLDDTIRFMRRALE